MSTPGTTAFGPVAAPRVRRSLAVGITAERRAHHQVRYLAARGIESVCAPALRTVDGATNGELLAATDRAVIAELDLMVVQTGQGLRWWLDAAAATGRQLAIERALAHADILCRGSKAASTVRGAGFNAAWQAPNETAADIVQHLAALDLRGKRVAIQLDGNDDRAIAIYAQAQGATVVELDVYRYALPLDVEPSLRLMHRVLDGTIDAVTFTSSPAIRHFREMADTAGCGEAIDHALSGSCLPVVVGPVCATTAAAAGWHGVIEPATPRLLPMLESAVVALKAQQEAAGRVSPAD